MQCIGNGSSGKDDSSLRLQFIAKRSAWKDEGSLCPVCRYGVRGEG